jgi:endonuclease III
MVSQKERYRRFIAHFSENMPAAETELQYSTPFELLVATILSAQCTDKRVNLITPAFFLRFPDAQSLAVAEREDVFGLIKTCSYPNNKTSHLLGMAQKLISDFGGVVPSDPEQLRQLPGVGRKTANVVASVVFGKPAMAVDTHVFRVAARIGLTQNAANPYQAEMQLLKHIPVKYVATSHHWLILHGRYICRARKPECGKCGISDFCKYYENSAYRN